MSNYQEEIYELIAGTVGGTAGAITGAPLDLIKVRLQSNVYPYKGTIDAATTIFRQEGPLAFWKGIIPPIVSNVPINAICFASYGHSSRFINNMFPLPDTPVSKPSEALHLSLLEQLKRDISPSITSDDLMRNSKYTSDQVTPNFMAKFIGGCWAGLLSCLFLCPAEFIKIQQQNFQGNNPRTTIQITRDIVRLYGIRALYRGWWATVIRETPSFGVYFGVYEYCKWLFRSETYTPIVETRQPETSCRFDIPVGVTWQHKVSFAPWAMLLAGGIAGPISWISTFPFDVIKTNIQSLPQEKVKTHGGLIYVTKQVAQQGIRTCFKGLTPTLIRAVPVNATVFYAYELTMEYCHRNDKPSFDESSAMIPPHPSSH